ncbi:unnamed protein product, partial [Candidula unifasciata]
SQEVGVKTIVILDKQGEQLDRIEEGMDQINQDMRDAEKNLEGLEKCCGLCVLPWKRSKNFEKGSDYNKTWKASEDGKINSNGPRLVVDQGSGGAPTGGYITRYQLNCQLLTSTLSFFQIGSQNEKLNQGGSLNIRVDEANKRANRILRNQ